MLYPQNGDSFVTIDSVTSYSSPYVLSACTPSKQCGLLTAISILAKTYAGRVGALQINHDTINVKTKCETKRQTDGRTDGRTLLTLDRCLTLSAVDVTSE